MAPLHLRRSTRKNSYLLWGSSLNKTLLEPPTVELAAPKGKTLSGFFSDLPLFLPFPFN